VTALRVARTAAAAPLEVDDALHLVRDNVRELLLSSDAYRQMPKRDRTELANAMVRVARYMVDAGGETRDVAPRKLIARPFAGDAPMPETGSADIAQTGTAAIEGGVQGLAGAIEAVDFPGFVSGLIDGVFGAIVKASIEQMEAYAALLQNVAKTADQYMKDNVTEDQARDHLVERYPDHLEADFGGGTPQLRAKRDRDDSAMPDFMRDLGLPFQPDSLDDDMIEEELVPAARKQIAIDRQRLLLSLVLMGINRIVVTDGRINASVTFNLDARDMARRAQNRQSTFQYHSTYSRERNPWFGPKTKFTSDVDLKVSVDKKAESESEAQLKVKLAGNVDLRFKSETFPLDKMSTILGLDAQEMRARGGERVPPAAQPAAPGIAPPPTPALPPGTPAPPALVGR
jgi:hypothetical protein